MMGRNVILYETLRKHKLRSWLFTYPKYTLFAYSWSTRKFIEQIIYGNKNRDKKT
jgi:hypothetical protein